MQTEFVDQDSETQKLLERKSTFDIFKNGFRKAMQNSKDKISLAKSISKKKIYVQHTESDIRVLKILPIEN